MVEKSMENEKEDGPLLFFMVSLLAIFYIYIFVFIFMPQYRMVILPIEWYGLEFLPHNFIKSLF